MTDTTNTIDDSRLTVTLKYGGDYAAPWAVIRGDTTDDIKQSIIDLLGGLKDNTVSEDWDLATLIASASIILQDRYDQAAKNYVDNIASQENTIVIDKINKATSKAQLADLLKQYKKIITSNPDVSEAFRTKRNSLTR
ncbi:hypothetical protein ACJ79_gp35 [Propionibacterium phage PHL199M00]|uniref:Uncharacterized protein n=1 Tax=Propionibacterium phage PHL199M00 TaxID=1500830 RepID=A0A0E3DPE0_9CAUD|nr:hypothetical protein ACJ79_gp35 [Propionibacterium phage PHL199M00]AII30066.1 hypothetical protein PHL199M00_35 [Propionibacterium phage PHL199M00]